MDNQFKEDNHAGLAESRTVENSLALPLIALGLVLSPILIVYIGSFIHRFSSFTLLFVVLMPIAGLITGIAALHRGKGRMSRVGKVIAIAAIVLPLAFIAFILIFFIGAATGMISLM